MTPEEHNEAVFAKIRKYWGPEAEDAARRYVAGELTRDEAWRQAMEVPVR